MPMDHHPPRDEPEALWRIRWWPRANAELDVTAAADRSVHVMAVLPVEVVGLGLLQRAAVAADP